MPNYNYKKLFLFIKADLNKKMNKTIINLLQKVENYKLKKL